MSSFNIDPSNTMGYGTQSSSSRRPTTLKLNQCDNGSEWTTQTEFTDQDCEDNSNPNVHRRTVIRKMGLKRNNVPVSLDSRVKLDRVLGVTVSNNASLDCDPSTGTVVYPSGCVLVLYNQRRNKQTHIINPLKKPITACKFSKDGKYIVTGECGHQPHVRVWDVASGEQIVALLGHRIGINCVTFSPDSKYVVSVGSQHDNLVNVWDWKNSHVVASNKVSIKVKAISFAQDGEYFVTVGNRHVKFWYLDYNDIASKNSKYESLPLMGRCAILGDQRNNYFCDVACGRGDSKESTYAITKSGLLCEFNNRRLLNKWVELKTDSANCISISQQYICVGCSQGVIRCFKPLSLEFVCTLPRPHCLGLDIAKGFTIRSEFSSPLTHKLSSNTKPKYADTVAVVYDEVNKVVSTIYSDRSIYYWHLGDVKRIGKLGSFFYHSSCIWDIEVYPIHNKSAKPLLPPSTFLTCSSDDTIRIWNTEYDQGGSSSKNLSYIYKKNFICPELLKILYMDSELSHLCDPDLVPSRSNNSNGNGNKDDTSYDSKNGVRAIKFSADGKHLASGDRCGNIRIFDLEQQRDLYKIEAHDAEVLCLEYSNEDICGRALLVSASRDRFIHIYDVHRQYSCIQNIDDHSSSIMSVKFVYDKSLQMRLQMVSCGADKSLMFRKQANPDSDFRLEHQVAGKATFYDMAVDVNKNQVVTASQDRIMRVFDTKSGKNINSFKGSLGDDGALIKVAFDPSATFIATSCTDKSIYIFDYQTGECLATTSGHSEIVTGLKFSQDGRHLISISGDGCIFIWKLPVEMSNAIAAKLGLPLISDTCQTTTISNRALNLPLQSPNESAYRNGNDIHQTNGNAYKFSTNSLPSWAKKQFNDRDANSIESPHDEGKDIGYKTMPKGRWAQRIMEEGPTDIILNQGLVKSYANTFESLASRSTPSTPSGTSSPTLRELKLNRANALVTPTRERAKSSLSSGVEDDDDDRNTTDSDNTCSHDSAYKVTKVVDKSKGSRFSKQNGGNFSMVSSLSMANINDLPFDEEESMSVMCEEKEKPDSKNRFNSMYMSTEYLERIDQRNNYLKSVFENNDKSNFESNANSASDDSGINQIDHSLSSTTTSVTMMPQPASRQSLSSKFNKTLSPSKGYPPSDGGSDDATLSDVTDINQDQPELPSALEPPKFSILDTIKETPMKEDNGTGTTTSMQPTLTTTTTTAIDQRANDLFYGDVNGGGGGTTLCSMGSNAFTTTVTLDSMPSTTATSLATPNQPSVSKRREEMAKTFSDAKKKLESVSWKGSSSLSNSKSVANLREPEEQDDKSYHSLSYDSTFRKSISLSDLTASQTLPKRLSVYRANKEENRNPSRVNMNNYQFAPLWDAGNRRAGPMPPVNSGSLSRTPSSTNLNKVDMMRSQSTLCRQGLWAPGNNQGPPMVPHPMQQQAAMMKPPNGHLINTPNGGAMMINPRSGRSSAPPSQFRKSSTTVSCASSRRGDSTEDDEELESNLNSDDENSDEHRTLRPRPVTPPKPNILKQIRRGSNASNQPNSAPQVFSNGHFTQHQTPTMNGQVHPASRRRLWSSDTMRSSKSEFNLANIGRDTPVRRRNNSGTGNIWPSNIAADRLDLTATNPSSIPLSLDLCQHLINEMNFLTTYAARIYERASNSNNAPIVEYLNETMGQVGRDIQLVVGRPSNATTGSSSSSTTTSSSLPSSSSAKTNALNAAMNNMRTNIPPETQEMFQKFLAFLQLTNSNNNNNHNHNNHNGNGDSARSIGNNNIQSSNSEHHFSS